MRLALTLAALLAGCHDAPRCIETDGVLTDGLGCAIVYTKTPITVRSDSRLKDRVLSSIKEINALIGMKLFLYDSQSKVTISTGDGDGARTVVFWSEEGNMTRAVTLVGKHAGQNTKAMIIHELFHVLGLEHDSLDMSIMNSHINQHHEILDYHVDKINQLYGGRE